MQIVASPNGALAYAQCAALFQGSIWRTDVRVTVLSSTARTSVAWFSRSGCLSYTFATAISL